MVSAIDIPSVLKEGGNNVLPFNFNWRFGSAVAAVAVVVLLACIQHRRGCKHETARHSVDRGKMGCEERREEDGKEKDLISLETSIVCAAGK